MTQMETSQKTEGIKAVETLQLDRVRYLLEQIKTSVPMFEELAGLSEEAKSKAQDLLTQYAMTLRGSKVKTEELESFFKKPYVIRPVPGKQDNWHLIIPRFIDANFGYLETQTESFNIFLVNRYMEWLGALPEELKRQLGWKAAPQLELRDYQKDAWNEFLRWSNIGVFYPPSVGKTFVTLWIISHIKGPHLIVVPSLILREQWEERIQLFTDLKLDVDVFVTTYQSAMKKHGSTSWSSLTVDECQHLPADQFSKLSLIKRKYTVGLSATPQREDGRENYIFALTGKPVGLGWQHFRDLGLISSPILHVHPLKNFEGKLDVLRRLLAKDRRTLIFADSIEVGRTIAARFDAPHIHGETKTDRIKTLEEAKVAVVSRVGDEGLSLPLVEMVVEVDFLFGSRRQEAQRFGRTLHSTQKGAEYHVLMTADEYLHDRKRLFSVMDKGFDVRIIEEGVTQETLAKRLRNEGSSYPRPRRSGSRNNTETSKADLPTQTQESGGAIAGVLQLPGIQRILSSLMPADKKLYTFLLQNDGKPFTLANLALLLGYSSAESLRHSVNLGTLIGRKLVEKVSLQGQTAYRTNIASKVSAS
ncbi:MAG: hypothetical protein AUJ07_08630 [Crenarchaeota archaeon 13_1_40CM_3_53_5]|nr:MAG: hypothetical protein AUJ07_08630 [Crenarchaeota archaeon 13_1_40CM_3_53_5]